jgi:hypothetical protein
MTAAVSKGDDHLWQNPAFDFKASKPGKTGQDFLK